MKRLYAPWRSSYTLKAAAGTYRNLTSDDCVFCPQIQADDDEKYWILKRFKHNVLALNKYPYNPGHLLIIPYAHVAELSLLTPEARAEMMEITTIAIEMLKNSQRAEGINVGMNLGSVAGAGIPSHLHMHILPRYHGDTNFLPTLADTKQISLDLGSIFNQLREYIQKAS